MRNRNRNNNNNTQVSQDKENPTSKPNNAKGNRTESEIVQWRQRGSNDPSWYAPSSQVIKDVASVPYGYPTGARQSLGPYTPVLNQFGTPGAMAINFYPCFGEITGRTSSINVSAQDLYQFVRHVNSGHANYDANDLMLYVLTVEQLYMWFAHIRRLYNAIHTFAYENRYYPEGLVAACGGDYSDLVQHMAEFRAYYNTAATKLNRFAVPKIFPIFDRHIQLCSNVYADGNTAKAQVYTFRPSVIFKFSYDSNDAGCLVEKLLDGLTFNDDIGYVNYSSSGLTFASIKTITEELLDALFNEEDFGIMTGDILKAYGTSSLWQVPQLTEDEPLKISVDMEMLLQIQNASLMGVRSASSISQDVNGGFLTQTLKYSTPYCQKEGSNVKYYSPNAFLADRYLNVDLDNPTPEDTIVASRLTNIGSNYNATTGTFDVTTRGSEIAEFAVIYRWKYTSTQHVLWKSKAYFTGMCNMLALVGSETVAQAASRIVQVSDFHNLMNLLSNFEYHPAIYGTLVVTERAKVAPTFEDYNTFDSVAFDLGKYTILGKTELDNMSAAAVIRLLGMKGI